MDTEPSICPRFDPKEGGNGSFAKSMGLLALVSWTLLMSSRVDCALQIILKIQYNLYQLFAVSRGLSGYLISILALINVSSPKGLPGVSHINPPISVLPKANADGRFPVY